VWPLVCAEHGLICHGGPDGSSYRADPGLLLITPFGVFVLVTALPLLRVMKN